MKIVLVSGDDWEGLYINDCLITEGHKVTVREVVQAISERLIRLDITYEWKEADYEWLHVRGDLPQELKKVKFLNDNV
jgi:hypothetical protein